MHASEWEAGVVWGSDSELDDLSDQQRQSQEDDDTELDQAQPSAPTHGMMSDSRAWPSAAPWQPSLEAVAEGTSVAALGFGAGLPDMQALLAGRGTSASTPEMTSSHLSRRVQRLSLVDAAKVEPLPSGKYPLNILYTRMPDVWNVFSVSDQPVLIHMLRSCFPHFE